MDSLGEVTSIGDRYMDNVDAGENQQIEDAHGEANEASSPPCCTLCSSKFAPDELPVTCASCQLLRAHVLCLADRFLEDCRAPPSVLVPIDGLCPACGTHMIWDALMDQRRRLLAETNGYFGGETVGPEDEDDAIYLTDEDEDEDENEEGEDDDEEDDDDDRGSGMGDWFDDVFQSDYSKPAAVTSAERGPSSSAKNKRDEDDCIDLITPVKGLELAAMSISDSPLSFGGDINADEEEEESGDNLQSPSLSSSQTGGNDIIDLTSP